MTVTAAVLRRGLRRSLAAVPPASGAAVMGTGIVSVALSLDGHEVLSRVLLAIAALLWVALGLLLFARFGWERARVRTEARSPAALTGVAATGVLGARLTLLGWDVPGIVLLLMAASLWAGLLWPVLRHWTTPTIGVSLILTVSTESLAVLAATLAVGERARWLVVAALVPFCLGLAFYVFVIVSFDLRQLAVGGGDHWITGGALAISTLAAGRITLAVATPGALHGLHPVLRDVSLALWVVTMCWLPLLLVAEMRFPRVRYDVRRWGTVFPFGMYAACSFVVGAAADKHVIRDFAHVWVWVALAVWVAVFGAMLRRIAQVIRRQGTLVSPGVPPPGRRAAR